jgi:hypothetical protein
MCEIVTYFHVVERAFAGVWSGHGVYDATRYTEAYWHDAVFFGFIDSLRRVLSRRMFFEDKTQYNTYN